MVIKNYNYKPQEDVEAQVEEAKEEPVQSEEDNDPIDIEKYTEEEEKIREEKQNKNKNKQKSTQQQWQLLEQQWIKGTNSNDADGGSRKTSEDWISSYVQEQQPIKFGLSKEAKLKQKQTQKDSEDNAISFTIVEKT